MKENVLKTKRGNIHYWIGDSWDENRDTIFFLHGVAINHTMFQAQMEYFQTSFNTITWDAPCHGKSRPYQSFSYANAVDDMLMILDRHQVKKFIAVGHSMGGYFVQTFIKYYPERIKAFIGIGTTPFGKGIYSKMDSFFVKQLSWITLCYPFSRIIKIAAKTSAITHLGITQMTEAVSEYTCMEYSNLIKGAYYSFVAENCNLKITCPVLLTVGESDHVAKVKAYCKKWGEKTGFPVVMIPKAGHNVTVDNPEAINRVIETFLKGI